MASRVLIVDDDRQIVRLLRSYLERAGFEVSSVYDGEAALPAIRHERPDLVVLDLMLPGRDGWEITRRLRADSVLSAIPVVMLTARVEDTDKIVGLELGADDYITKPFNPPEVVARIRAVLRRSAAPPAPAHILQARKLKMEVDRHRVTVDDAAVELTPTEFALLRTLLENPGHVFTRGELAEKALGYNFDGLDRTVDSHIKNLRRKLEVEPGQPDYIETVYGVGYSLNDQAGGS